MGKPQLDTAVALLRSGDFAQAAQVARQVVSLEPGNAEAHNTLGTALAQSGDANGAERAYLMAAKADPELYKPHANLANLYAASGRLELAAARLREATRLSPGAARLWLRLGQVLGELRAFAEAEQALRRAVEVEDTIANRVVLARLLLRTGSGAGALGALPWPNLEDDPLAVSTFAEACIVAGDPRLREAIGAAAALPVPADAAVRLARAAIQIGSPRHAVDLARRAREAGADPLDDDAVMLEAACLEAAGERAQACQLLESAFNARPGVAKAVALGEIARRGGPEEQAAAVLQAARVLFPESADVLVAWGRLARAGRSFDDAHAAFEAALRLEPEHPGALLGLGVSVATIAPGPEAVALLERASRAAPSDPAACSALLFAELHAGVWSPDERLERHRSYARRFCQVFRTASAPAGDAPRSGGRLRLGYLSSDFRDHAIMRFMEGVLSAHDRSRVELFAYGSVTTPDQTTQRVREMDLAYRDISALPDASAAAVIAKDRLDVLVVLDGHTAGGRVRIAAFRPAPVIVSMLGYPATTGLPDVDYRVTDAVADPPGAEAHYTEALVRLPHAAWCFGSGPDVPTARDNPGPICFATFNRSAKLSAPLLRCYQRILEALPEARLLLKARTTESDRMRRHIRAALGPVADRVDLVKWTADHDSHLKVYQQVDVALDTFPYAGTTTTAEALWMGVPVVTLAGRAHVERVGASLLKEIGLDDLIATNEDEYVAAALRIAGEVDRRAQLRTGLRERMRAGPLGDARKFVASLEDCLIGLTPRRPAVAPGSRLVETDLGAKLVVPERLDTATTFVIIEQRRWFEDEVPFVRELIGPSDVFVDIGANLGVYTIEAALRASRVVAFEPAGPTAARLRASVAANGLSNVTIHQVALGGQDGQAQLVLGGGPELSHLGAGPGPSETVPVRTLNAFAADFRGATFLKLDAEGSEQAIVEAAGDLLREVAPVVMFELRHVNQYNFGLLSSFTALGFQLYRLMPGLRLLSPFDQNREIDPFQLNLFAVAPSRIPELEARGLLATGPAAEVTPATDEEVAAWVRSRPHLAGLSAEALLRASTALRHWLRACDRKTDPRRRLAAGLAAQEAAQADLAGAASPEARLTAARIHVDLGYRVRAQEVLEPLERLEHAHHAALRSPFPCVLAEYEARPFDPRRHFVLQSLEAQITLGAFSSCYQKPGIIGMIEGFFRRGGASPEMDRRLGLLLARDGLL